MQRPGGFLFRYELQPLQPPERPAPVSVPEHLVTRHGAHVSWSAPATTLPILFYRLQHVRIGVASGGGEEGGGGGGGGGGIADVVELVVSSAVQSMALTDLMAGATYDVRVQAWTTEVEPSGCSDGEVSACSQFSWPLNFTTPTVSTQWHLSVGGSYLFGVGTRDSPWPMDIQGAIDRPEVANGAELVLHPGVWSSAAMAGPGRVADLSLRGKLLTLRSLPGEASSTILDCTGSSGRLLTFNHSEPPSVQLIGLTIRNCGGAPDGRGALWITAGSRPTIVNVTFEANVGERGGAFVADDGAAPRFESCTFVGNSALSGCPCVASKLSGDECHTECNLRECGWGGCCPAMCEASWGDGFCVAACNTAACGYDGGDCCATSSCAASRADGTCDAACNDASCGFDGGDCDVDAGIHGVAWR